MLISTKANSKGKEAILYRSRQLTEFEWTPVRDIPVYTKATGKTKLAAGEKKKGMIYSSTEPTDKFVTENISFETFLNIVANPDSAIYNKDLDGHNNSWAYFGLVCNGLVRYALNIRRRFSTKRWATVPGMRKVADDGDYKVEQIELCDVLYAYGKGRNHVALITDILRDESGKICEIEVSEAIRPTCVRVSYEVEKFYERFELFALWRYDFADEVPMPDERQDELLKRGVPELPAIAIDYGNKTNYRTYEDVVISVFAEGENEIEISGESGVIETLKISGKGKVLRKFDRGYYKVLHKNSGEFAEFCVTEPELKYSIKDGKVTIKASSKDPESKILYMEFREGARKNTAGKDDENNVVIKYSTDCAPLSKVEELTDEEKETGIITREIPEDAGNFKIYFENKYGVWTHTMVKL